MQPANKGQRLKDFLTSHDIQPALGLAEEVITKFEQHHKVHIPTDLREYFRAMNGSADAYAYGIIRFWGLNEVESVVDVVSRADPSSAVIQTAYRDGFEDAEHYYVVADFLHELQLYAIKLLPSQRGPNEVIILDGSPPTRVADSFSEFVDFYVDSPERLHLAID
ncbi:MAG: SMI1/KNR4 family protein [Planctomycetes bacterium]|nr:SMI1/KNR4 family protein [Planctomycetota bacterium]